MKGCRTWEVIRKTLRCIGDVQQRQIMGEKWCETSGLAGTWQGMVITLKKWQEMLTHVKEMVGDAWKRGWGF